MKVTWDLDKEKENIRKHNIREPLKTEVFRGFLTPWRKSRNRNCLYYKELAIFSAAPLETQPGFPEVPISFSYAAEVFHDDHRLVWYDAAHSGEEDRYINIGKADDEVVVFVVETESSEDEIRIITARKAGKRERKAYADG